MHHKIITFLLFCLFITLRLNAQLSTNMFFHHPFTDTNLCAGASITVFDSIVDGYLTGNIFTVQLSDAQGSFANPVSIGSTSAINTGSIFCTIPANTPTGLAYRIRILASNPPDTSGDNGINIRISNLSYLSLSSNSPVCTGDTIRINAADTAAGAVFSFTGPNNISANVQHLVIPHSVYADSGMFYVTASLGACSITDSIDITLNSVPATPQWGSQGPRCVGESMMLSALSGQGGTYYTYYWITPSNTIDTMTVQSASTFYKSNLQLTDSGIYKVIAKLGSCASDTAFINIPVYPLVLPSVSITSNPSPVLSGIPVHFTASLVNGGSLAFIYWRKNGLNIAGGTNLDTITITPTYGDIISAYLISTLQCANPDTANSNGISCTGTGVGSYINALDIKIYPDPVTTDLFIDAPVKTSCSISRIDGKEIVASYSVGVHDTKSLNTGTLSSGLYVLRLYDESGILIKVHKLIKE